MRKMILMATAIGCLTLGFAAGRVSAQQPHMQAAKAELQSALGELEQAEPNKGGHRERAIGFVNQAIIEVQLGIDWARN